LMRTEAKDLVEEKGRVTGVLAETPDGTIEISAALVVGADGRHSTVRAKAELQVQDLGAPMDVLWLRLPRRAEDGGASFGFVGRGAMLVTLDRGDYWQCAYVIAKGGFDAIKAQGLDAFRAGIVRLRPGFADRMDAIRDWDDVKLLTVAVDRLKRWYRPGLLVIGDAAHAMSPIGGIGINLAIQDAVAAANIVAGPLRRGTLDESCLAAVQKRRELPTRMTQGMQLFVQDHFINHVLAGDRPIAPPLPARLLMRYAPLRRMLARVIGIGFRPEHVAPL
jgi:2-polyprenyl-6-methoxyphenol hydroxylase-like FAD-dependent oxidoreductase